MDVFDDSLTAPGPKANVTKCVTKDVLAIMIKFLGEDSPAVKRILANKTCPELPNSTYAPIDLQFSDSYKADLKLYYNGLSFYAYATPFIIIIGLLGNGISLRIFNTGRMRKASASLYLSSLATADILVLVTYVLMDWLNKGMPIWPGERGANPLGTPGVCEVYLYFSYCFRFLSAWIIVIFTMERYVGVCRPLHRRALCTNSLVKRALAFTVFIALLVSLYKPLLSEVAVRGEHSFCTKKEQYVMLNFIMDAIYGFLITGIPFMIIAALNCLIIRKLQQTKRAQLMARRSGDETSIKFEFTVILLLISTTFVLLNLPYFILWCYNFAQEINQVMHVGNPTETERIRGWFYITRTIFFCNYCVNFFLYSMTGSYFRRQLIQLLCGNSSCVRQKCQSSATQFTPVATSGSITRGIRLKILHEQTA